MHAATKADSASSIGSGSINGDSLSLASGEAAAPGAERLDDGLAWSAVQSVRAHRTGISCGAVSLDGRWLATGCAGMTTRAAVAAKETPIIRIWALAPKVAGRARRKYSDPGDTAASGSAGPAAAPPVLVATTGAVDDGLVDFCELGLGGTARAAAAVEPSDDVTDDGELPVEPSRDGDSLGDDSHSAGDGVGYEDEVDVACGGLFGGHAVAEGHGHGLTITSILWLPQPDGGVGVGGGRVYHLVTGSRDGELRQWCVTLPDGAPDALPPDDSAPVPVPTSGVEASEAPVKVRRVREKVVPANERTALQCVRSLVAAPSQVSSLAIFSPPAEDAEGWSVVVASSDVAGSAFTWRLPLPSLPPLQSAGMRPPPAPGSTGLASDSGDLDPPAVLAKHSHASVRHVVPLLTRHDAMIERWDPFVLLGLSSPFNSAGATAHMLQALVL